MVANPMQRKARNSFLLGMLIAIIIMLIAGGMLYFLFLKDQILDGPQDVAVAYVYKLKAGVNVKSGDSITPEMVEEVKTVATNVPTDAVIAAYKVNNVIQPVQFPNGYKSKIALNSGTILGASMLYTDDLTDKTLRLVEYNMITLPSTIVPGEYVDIRITLPTGEDYSILTKKCVVSVQSETIGMYLTEEEILTMSCAIIDLYTMDSGNIYAIKYVEPGNQAKASPTYVVKQSILELMRNDANIVSEAVNALIQRWNAGASNDRANIESTLGLYSEEALDNIKENMEEQLEKARELYLNKLAGY